MSGGGGGGGGVGGTGGVEDLVGSNKKQQSLKVWNYFWEIIFLVAMEINFYFLKKNRKTPKSKPPRKINSEKKSS